MSVESILNFGIKIYIIINMYSNYVLRIFLSYEIDAKQLIFKTLNMYKKRNK